MAHAKVGADGAAGFARFLRMHRQAPCLEADIRSELRREGILGTVEILLHKVPRVIGG